MLKKTLLLLAAAACAAATHASAQMLEITEIYGAGGNTGATGMSDYVELYNPSTTAVSLANYSLQYASGTGAFATTASVFTTLSGTVQPQSYFLIKLSTGTTGTALPAADFTNTSVNLAATAGKVALSNQNTAAISGSTDASVVDFVGYGAATTYKGTGPAPAPSTTTSISRSTLTGPSTNNNTDFTAGPLSPTNSAGATAPAPEPSTYACVMIGGLAALMMLRARRCA